MKKLNKLLCVALLASVCFASCKKDSDTGTTGSTEEVGTGITVGGKTYLISKIKLTDKNYDGAEYDAQGRLTKYTTFYNGEVEEYSSLIYSGNTVTITNYYEGVANQKTIVNLGSNNYASDYVSTDSYTENGFTLTYKTTGKFTHNSDGYVTKLVGTTVTSSTNPNAPQLTENSTTDYTYSGGNLTKTIETYVKAGVTTTYTRSYEYNTDKSYSPVIELEQFNFLFTKPSKNLLKKDTQTSSGSNNSPYIESYTYTYNSDGLPTTLTSGNTTQTIEYVTK